MPCSGMMTMTMMVMMIFGHRARIKKIRIEGASDLKTWIYWKGQMQKLEVSRVPKGRVKSTLLHWVLGIRERAGHEVLMQGHGRSLNSKGSGRPLGRNYSTSVYRCRM